WALITSRLTPGGSGPTGSERQQGPLAGLAQDTRISRPFDPGRRVVTRGGTALTQPRTTKVGGPVLGLAGRATVASTGPLVGRKRKPRWWETHGWGAWSGCAKPPPTASGGHRPSPSMRAGSSAGGKKGRTRGAAW